MSDSTSIESLPGPASNGAASHGAASHGTASQVNNIQMNVSDTAPKQLTPEQLALNSGTSTVPIVPAQVDPNAMGKVMSGLQAAHMQGMTQLASRDIPMPTTQFTQDPQIKPNYIPPAENSNYIQEEETYEMLLQKKQQKIQDDDRLDMLYDELQLPVLIMVLFFLFQMPFMQKKFLHFLPSLFHADGNISMGGYITKTLLFGFSFYLIMKISKYASEL